MYQVTTKDHDTRLFSELRIAQSYARGCKGTLKAFRDFDAAEAHFCQTGASMSVDLIWEDEKGGAMATYYCALPTARRLYRTLRCAEKQYHQYE